MYFLQRNNIPWLLNSFNGQIVCMCYDKKVSVLKNLKINLIRFKSFEKVSVKNSQILNFFSHFPNALKIQI